MMASAAPKKRTIRTLMALFGLLSLAIIANAAYHFFQLNTELKKKISHDMQSKLNMVLTLHNKQIEKNRIISNIAREQSQKYCDFLDYNNVNALTSMLKTMATIYDIDIVLLYDESNNIVTSYPGGSTFVDPVPYRKLPYITPDWNGVAVIGRAILQEQYPEKSLDISDPELLVFHSSVELLHDTGDISGRIVLLHLIPGNEILIQDISRLSDIDVVYYSARRQPVLSSFGEAEIPFPAGEHMQVNEGRFRVIYQSLPDDKGETVGYLAGAMDEGPFLQHRRNVILASLTSMIITVLIFGVIIYLLKIQVFTKIELLSQALRKVTLSSTDFSIRIPVTPVEDNKPNDEVATMIIDFNQMMTKLEDTYHQMIMARQEVEAINRKLEHRVFERTRELQNQVGAKEKALKDLAAAQSSLMEASRAAGRAEVATGVLHNVGNVLNSINVSCTLLRDQLRESRVGNVSRVAGLITEPEGGPAHFLSEDSRGRQIPAYLASLGSALQEEHQVMSREAESLHEKIEHIKEIVTMQQTYGRISGVKETIAPEQLMEDALKLNSEALVRQQVMVQRSYQPVAPITVDKHKVLQILLNLINNAKHACTDDGNKEKIITLQIFSPDPDRLCMQVADNGIGIAPENLNLIFQHGFTTKKSGHGFGLHSGALAAKELGGSLTVDSDGPGLGATFTLELPCTPGDR